MKLSHERLTKIAPPPIHPVAPGSPAGWDQIEAEIGIRLPEDFKDYIGVYGAGQWANFFGVINPFYEWKHPPTKRSWRKWMQDRLEFLDEWQEKHAGDVAPFRCYPAPGGLLAFGYDDCGGTLCWKTVGEVDSWSIICLDAEFSKQFDRFDMSLTTFLAELLTAKICPRTFPEDFSPLRKTMFRPYTDE